MPASFLIVKDYLYEGNYIIGHFDSIKDNVVYYLLEDCDLYSEKELIESGYEYKLIDRDDLIDYMKQKFS